MRSDDYMKALRERGKTSRIYRKYQLDGLEIAVLLGDERHKALYIKLAKERDTGMLRRLAASIAEQPNVKNKGALFMYLLKEAKKRDTPTPPADMKIKKTRRKPSLTHAVQRR